MILGTITSYLQEAYVLWCVYSFLSFPQHGDWGFHFKQKMGVGFLALVLSFKGLVGHPNATEIDVAYRIGNSAL